MPAIRRCLAALCLLAAMAPPAMAGGLGDAIAAVEQRMAAMPEARAAGPDATARYVAGMVSACLEVFEQSRHLDRPYFGRSAGIDGKPGLFNPDNLYRSALLSDRGVYQIRGRRGTHAMLTLQLLDAYPIVALGRNLAVIDLDQAGVGPGQDFTVTLGGERVDGLWQPLPAGARAVLARQTFEDWRTETPSTLSIERLDTGAPPVDPGVPGVSAADYVATADKLWNSGLYGTLPDNAFPPPRASDSGAGGLGGQQSVMARYRLTPDTALLVTVRRSNARYQGIQLGDPWFVTPNFTVHQSSLSRAQAVTDTDGKLRFVIALSDPGVANWLDPAGFAEGFVFLRWQGLPAPLGSDDAASIEVVSVAELRGKLPPGTRWLDADARRAQLAERRLPPNRM